MQGGEAGSDLFTGWWLPQQRGGSYPLNSLVPASIKKENKEELERQGRRHIRWSVHHVQHKSIALEGLDRIGGKVTKAKLKGFDRVSR